MQGQVLQCCFVSCIVVRYSAGWLSEGSRVPARVEGNMQQEEEEGEEGNMQEEEEEEEEVVGGGQAAAQLKVIANQSCQKWDFLC